MRQAKLGMGGRWLDTASLPSSNGAAKIEAATVANRRAGPAAKFIGAVRTIDRTVTLIFAIIEQNHVR